MPDHYARAKIAAVCVKSRLIPRSSNVENTSRRHLRPCCPVVGLRLGTNATASRRHRGNILGSNYGYSGGHTAAHGDARRGNDTGAACPARYRGNDRSDTDISTPGPHACGNGADCCSPGANGNRPAQSHRDP